MASPNLSRTENLAVRLIRLLLNPGRIVLAVMRRLGLGSHELKCALDLYPRPHYAYGVQQAAVLAQRLGIPRISVIEFGVAGGAGLAEMTRMAKLATEDTGVEIDVYGFDTGAGLPKPTDYRDLPYVWQAGDFVMDVDALRRRVPDAHLELGDIEQTLPPFLGERKPAPIGFVSIDVDYYSSTVSSLKLFRGDSGYFLPRVFCYFDDTVGDDDQVVHSDKVGELAAIREFNEETKGVDIARINGLADKRAIRAPWNDLIYVAHFFDHPDYGTYVGRPDAETQLPLDRR
jgi:hypothetical protein